MALLLLFFLSHFLHNHNFSMVVCSCCAGKMRQPKMGAAQHGPMNGMHNWDPTLAGYMQTDYNMHDPGMMASQLYGGNPNVHPPAGLRLSGKFQAAAAAGTDSWTPYGGLMDFPAVLHRKYEPKEQIGRYGNVNEFVIR